ncbi:virulence factor SrfB [Azospirillum halopraeferens]|uniref:virulence factor SrfB n=1 Tax=Azospirillum halopraeferens TaxID=34010 RepID=UPI0003F7290F|nr:virulence factor SrfB [Azospirillum halopraeferens]
MTMSGAEPELRRLCDWKGETTLVPFSGIQILDFGFAIDRAPFRAKGFIERITGREGDLDVCTLLPLTGDDDLDADVLKAGQSDDTAYDITLKQALEPFLGAWLPAPLLRIRPGRGANGAELYDAGPSTWCRVRIIALPAPDGAGNTHRVQLAIDTALVAEDDLAYYLTPSRKDAEDEREFRFVADASDVAWFLRRPTALPTGEQIDVQSWVSEWLEEEFLDYKRAQRRGKPLRDEDLPYRFEHWARYLTLISLIEAVVDIPKIRLLDVVSAESRYAPVEVDLVLDVGNSRTCGILIESFPGDARVNLNDSYALELRDLSQPELSYSRLLESRVEFAEATFGREHVARRSGRRNAFIWPSFVRIGPEAMNLVRREEGTEITSGLSSPKRYLWDEAPVNQNWRFQNVGANQALPMIARSAFRFLNERGDVIRQLEEEEKRGLRRRNRVSKDPAIRPRFSRSSLFGFMLAEIFCHALVQINDPAARASRAQSSLPRRLRSIILTLPSATPIQEQAIIRSRAEGALKLIWSILDIRESTATTCRRPNLIVEWDEATCTQLVFLYTEISRKFNGDIDGYLALKGKPRPLAGQPGGAPQPSLRLACVDIGGGTTDLMITTYHGESNRVVHPYQTFREGFRIAGDDLLRDVISALVLPRIRNSIEAAGGQYAQERLKSLFGGDVGGQDEQIRQRRRQFALRVLMPLGLALLERCEHAAENDIIHLRAVEVLGRPVLPRKTVGPAGRDAVTSEGAPVELALPRVLIDYLEAPARASGATDWSLAEFECTINRAEVDAVVRDVFQKALSNMVEVIGHLDCDVILLTGRPSRLPAVRAILREMLAVTPDRLISMHRYRVEGWYPYRDLITNRISDPKSTVAVGAMLCALSGSRIDNFRMMTNRLGMRSTARFIGEMALNGQILNDRLLLHDIDLDGGEGGEEVQVKLYTPIHIGFRQLPLERWTTTPLYRLEFSNPGAASRPAPLSVTLRRSEFDSETETAEENLKVQALREAFEVIEVEDADQVRCMTSDVRLTLQTIGFESDYWLDSGVFRFV